MANHTLGFPKISKAKESIVIRFLMSLKQRKYMLEMLLTNYFNYIAR